MEPLFASLLLAFIQGIGGPELLFIFLIALLFFGASRLPELARGMGKSIKEFRKAASELENDVRSAVDTTDPNTSAESEPAGKPKQIASPAQEKQET
jgi:TatA/E family protein of Tat protein translocase